MVALGIVALSSFALPPPRIFVVNKGFQMFLTKKRNILFAGCFVAP